MPAPLPPVGTPLTLQAALDRAQQCHPNVVSAELAAIASAAALTIQSAQLKPHLTLEGNISRSKTLGGINPTLGSDVPGTQQTNRNLDMALEYTLYQTGVPDLIRKARMAAQASKLSIPDAQRLLGFQVRQNYYNALAQRQLGKSLVESIANAERHRDLVQARIDAGTAARSDLPPVEVEVAQARLQAVQTETTLDTALAALKALIMAPAECPLDLSDTLPAVGCQPNTCDMIALAQQNRPDVLAQKYTIMAAHYGTLAARAQAGVQWDVTATGDYGRHSGITGEEWELFLGATYPLYDAGASRAAVTQARANEGQSTEALNNLLLGIQRDVETAVAGLQQATTAIDVATVGRKSAETALAAAEARYREGLAIIIEVTDAQTQLLQAQVSEVQARYDYAVALATLAYATGCEVPLTPAAPTATPAAPAAPAAAPAAATK